MAAGTDSRGRGTGERLARWGLAPVLIAYCFLAVAQSGATRLQWGPDEPGHIIYVRSLAMDGRFPGLTHGEEDDGYLPGAARTHEAHQPPLYYALAALVWRAFAHLPDQTVRFTDGQGATHSFTAPGPVGPVRLLSVIFGAAGLAFTWATARIVFPGRPALWLGGSALAAFIPMFTYMSGVINNDALLVLAFSAATWQWARMLRYGADSRRVAVLGILVGLAMSVKETAVALALVSMAAAAAAPGAWRVRAERAAAVAAIGGAMSCWWFVRKWVIHGSPLVYPYIYPLLGLPEEQRSVLLGQLPGLVFRFAFVPADVIGARVDLELVSRLLLALVVLAAGGLVLAFVRRERSAMPAYEVWSLGLWLGLAALVALGLVRNVLTVDWRMGTSGGRYLVCVLPLLSLAAARGISSLFADGRWAKLALAVVCLGMLVLNLATIWATAMEYGTLGIWGPAS